MVEHILQVSLENHQVVTIMYQKGSDITKRKIKVTKLTDSDVEAYCYLRHQVRHFKKGNILAASLYTQ